jgi:hypothetical protein
MKSLATSRLLPFGDAQCWIYVNGVSVTEDGSIGAARILVSYTNQAELISTLGKSTSHPKQPDRRNRTLHIGPSQSSHEGSHRENATTERLGYI